jgi:hypothetical protein
MGVCLSLGRCFSAPASASVFVFVWILSVSLGHMVSPSGIYGCACSMTYGCVCIVSRLHRCVCGVSLLCASLDVPQSICLSVSQSAE